MQSPRDLGKAALKRASDKLLGALSRADELGGMLRDQLSERLAERSAARVAARAAAAESDKAPVRSQPSPAVTVPPSGLGDPRRAVQIFGRASCPWSGRALALVERAGLEHSYFDLNGYGSDAVLRELKLETKQDSVPYVYVRGRFIGGYNALDELARLGHLEYLALPEHERAQHPMHGRIEVLPRRHDGERIPGEA
jgi:glutaredoxin